MNTNEWKLIKELVEYGFDAIVEDLSEEDEKRYRVALEKFQREIR